ncbi:sugar transferase [Sphingomonas adhaesiva]|uniref:sugar transferase n=1 Tax=Sphingomonas adhaesiva TaxID=28212 RepID=UPI002FFC0AAE
MDESFGGWQQRQIRGVVTAAPTGSPLSVRIADRLLAALLLVFFLPLMVAVALVVMVTDPGPVIFGHVRVGRSGRSFRCLKFRSMVVDAESRLQAVLASDPALQAAWDRDHKLPSDPRITPIGRFLRASSLDELPQLINVLRGEMSLVGPRPISSSEVPRYGRYIVDYYHTTPGLTGLWQISGRNDVSYRRRVALDVAFSRSQSLSLYLRILVMTVPAVLLARGSY